MMIGQVHKLLEEQEVIQLIMQKQKEFQIKEELELCRHKLGIMMEVFRRLSILELIKIILWRIEIVELDNQTYTIFE